MPADFFGILSTLKGALHTLKPEATLLALASLATMVLWQFTVPKFSKSHPWTKRLSLVPGSVVALVLATAFVALTKLPVETIGSRLGGIPSSLPAPQVPGVLLGHGAVFVHPGDHAGTVGCHRILVVRPGGRQHDR